MDNSDYIYDDIAYNSENIYWQEALHVYEKLLKMDISAKYHGEAIFTMILLYKRMGFYEKAKALANEQNTMLLCKEILLPKATVGEERDKYQGENIIALLQELYVAISDSVALKTSVYNAEYAKCVLSALANLLETIFYDNRFGSQHINIRELYLALANYEAQHNDNIQTAIDYFDKAYTHHEEYCRICNMGEYHYSAPLLSHVTVPAKNFPPVPEHFWKNRMQSMPTNLRNELRKNEKYANYF